MSFQFRLVSNLLITCLAVVFLSSCQPRQTTPTAPGEQDQITPYWTATPSPTATTQPLANSPTATSVPATIPPPPTPTPYTYVIEEGDTMGVIAYNFGVTVADLRAANPEVDPNLMSVGTVLVIPIIETNAEGTPEALATPTPIAVQMSQPDCYPAKNGGVWCLALARNAVGQPVENLVAWMQLVSSEGEVLAGEQAIPPLNLLPDGMNLPVMAFFPDTQAVNASAQVEVISALPVPPNDERYRPVGLQVDEAEISPDGLRAAVRGSLTLLASPSPTPTPGTQEPGTSVPDPTPTGELVNEDNGSASQFLLAVIGYDADNRPIGVRKWETTTSLFPGEAISFEIEVFSLGPVIERVEVLAEAQP